MSRASETDARYWWVRDSLESLSRARHKPSILTEGRKSNGGVSQQVSRALNMVAIGVQPGMRAQGCPEFSPPGDGARSESHSIRLEPRQVRVKITVLLGDRSGKRSSVASSLGHTNTDMGTCEKSRVADQNDTSEHHPRRGMVVDWREERSWNHTQCVEEWPG
jgi:hypothetical protein